ncbi:MAG: prepilin-type N-terminal cleavage/methylation domain-containing protein [Steroidobacteraceae bacterium]
MRGFTLIELLIVILIVSLLAMIASPSYMLHYASEQEANAIRDFNSIRTDLTTQIITCGGGVPNALANLNHYPGGTCPSATLGYYSGPQFGAWIQAITLVGTGTGVTVTLKLSTNTVLALQGQNIVLTTPVTAGMAALNWSCTDPLFYKTTAKNPC